MPKKKISLQAKHLRQSKKRQLRNMAIKSTVKTAITKARTETATTPAEATQSVRSASRVLDKAATKGVIHRRTAARKKSRLTRQLNKALSTSAGEA